jgi:hypothetical protein
LYLGEGCASLFTYCTQVLHFSEHAAYRRIQAARVACRFPVVLEMLATGDVHLTSVGLLAPQLTAENHRELLTAARHKSKRQVEEIVARVRPLPDAATVIRQMPASPGRLAAAGPAEVGAPSVPAPPAPVPPVTVNAQTYAALRRAQDPLRHQFPDGDAAAVIARALTALVEKLEKRVVA